MALQIWLPLTKNSLNYGVHPSIVTESNTSLNTNGKLGGCYSFANSAYLMGTHNLITNDTNEWSFACWMKLNATTTGQTLFSCRTSTAASGIAIFYYGSQWLIDDGVRWNLTPKTTISANRWYHICVVRKKGVGKYLYIDGVLDSSTSTTGTPTIVNTSNYTIGVSQNSGSATGNPLNGYLNDVRFYDHALSVVEIKELAKGLVCHYKLDEFYSADNLIINGFGELGTENWNNGSYISTTEIPPGHPEIKASMHSGNMTKQYIPIIQNHTYTISGYIKAMSGTTGNTYPSIYGYDIDKKFIDYYKCAAGFNSTYRTTLAQPLHKGDTVIYATDLSAWTTGDNHFYHVAIFGYQNSLGEVYPDMVYTQDSPVFGTKTDKSHIDKTNNTITLNTAFTGEDRPAGTTICQATEGSVYLYPWGGIDVSTIPDWVFKTANFKPSTSSRLNAAAYIRWSTYGRCYIAGNKLVDIVASDDTIIDSSGYGYHGIKTGILSPSIDTPRYSLSTNFPENSSTVTITPYLTNNQTLTEISVSCWYKTNTLNSTAPNLWSLGENSFLRLRLASTTSIWYYARVGSTQTGYTYTVGKTLTDNTWHHVVLTFKNGVFVVYIDGSQIGTSDASGTATYLTCANTAWHLAGYTANSENFIGNLSDFRIYTTCLSADDVLRLYNTAASVSKNGALLGYEMKEEL